MENYTAQCHCGKIRFSFKCDTISTGVRCNCSVCIRKGAVMSSTYIPHDNFSPISNTEELEDYRWNDKVVNHIFCKSCGIYPYHGNKDWGYRVNLGCVNELNALELDIRVLDGKSMPVRKEL